MDDQRANFPVYRAAFSGLLAMFLAVGVARFGYAPMVPALVAAGWFTAAQAFWLGAINLLGYLIGAAGMRQFRGRLHARPAVLVLMGLTVLALAGSALNFGFAWFAMWRLLSGITGGVLMVLMAAAVVRRAPAAQRGRVSGITFAGMGAGICLSALAVPVLLSRGLPFTWVALAGLGAAATAVVTLLMPASVIIAAPAASASGGTQRAVWLLLVAYALCAFGFVPHMLFLASFVAIGLHRGVAAGAHITAWMGLAAAVGPVVLGRIADRFGFLATLAVSYVVMAAAVGLPLVSDSPGALILSAVSVGAVALGAVMLASGAIAGLVAPEKLAADWGLATMAYAVMQAAVAAGFSALFHATGGDFLLLFGIGSAATAVCAVTVFAAARLARAA
jgi:predicted MFS family arabinose efflux permease